MSWALARSPVTTTLSMNSMRSINLSFGKFGRHLFVLAATTTGTTRLVANLDPHLRWRIAATLEQVEGALHHADRAHWPAEDAIQQPDIHGQVDTRLFPVTEF